MFEPLRIERVPSRIREQEGNALAFAMHPDPSSCALNTWNSCTVTSNIDVIFHRSEYHHSSRFRIPGVREKKNTPYFFRLSCDDAAQLAPHFLIKSADVIDYTFSECSKVNVETGEVADHFAQKLPTIAMLISASNTETNLLILRPVLRKEGKETAIRYSASCLPASENARHVVISRCGGAVFLLNSSISEREGTLQCYALRINSNDPLVTSSFCSIRLMVPVSRAGTSSTAACSQSILWASIRRPLCHLESASHIIHSEITILSNHGTLLVFHVGLGDEKERHSAVCTWFVNLQREESNVGKTFTPLGVLTRWKSTSFFAHALKEAKSPETMLERNRRETLHDFSSSAPIVSESPNGAVLCIAKLKEHTVFLVGLGSNVEACDAVSCASVSVPTPPNVRVCDVTWVGGSLCGFLLLAVPEEENNKSKSGNGSGDGVGRVMLFFLPLTGHKLLRIHLEQTHESSLVTDGGDVFSFFSRESIQDMFGATQLCLSLHYRRGNGDEKCNEVRTGLLSLPTMNSLKNPAHHPSHVLREIYFTGLASFATIHKGERGSTKKEEEGSTVRCIPSILANNSGGDDDDVAQVSMEAALESSLDPWLHAGAMASDFPLSSVMHEMIFFLLEDVERNQFIIYRAHKNDGEKFTALLSVFRALADIFASMSVIFSPPILSHYLPEIHGLLVMLRHGLTVMGQRGAMSVCFTAVSFFAQLDERKRVNESSCPEWRALIAPLFDDAFAHVCSCPSLSHTLLPFCSAALQRMISVGEYLLRREEKRDETTVVPLLTVDVDGSIIRPLEETLALARRGKSGFAMLSAADVCWTARRLFLRDGVGPARAFLKTIVGHHSQCHPDVLAVSAEYDVVQRELAAVLDSI